MARRNPHGRPLYGRHSKTQSATPAQEREAEQWAELVQPMFSAIAYKPKKGVAPYDLPANVLKREIYRLVTKLLARTNGSVIIESAVIVARPRNPRSPTLQQNPFFWALTAVSGPAELKRYQITRFSKELLYAQKHDIPADLLVGFIYQCGPTSIYAKATSDRETWFSKPAP